MLSRIRKRRQRNGWHNKLHRNEWRMDFVGIKVVRAAVLHIVSETHKIQIGLAAPRKNRAHRFSDANEVNWGTFSTRETTFFNREINYWSYVRRYRITWRPIFCDTNPSISCSGTSAAAAAAAPPLSAYLLFNFWFWKKWFRRKELQVPRVMERAAHKRLD